MATPRSIWKGSLKLSLVSIPAKLYSAAEPKSKVSFKRLHDTCGSHTNNKIWCPACQVDITNEQCVKGYEYGKGQHVLFTDAELDALDAAKSTALEITTVTNDVLPPIYIDSSMYLIPDQGAQQAFETIKQALAGRTAVGTIVLRDRTVQVALVPQVGSQVFLVYRLRAASQVRDIESLDHGSMMIVPPKNDVALAKQLLDSIQGAFDFSDVQDDYTERVKELLESKINGTAPVVVTAPAAPKVTSLQEALAESLKLAAAKASKPAVAALPAKAAAVAKASLQKGKGKAAKAS